VFSISIECEKDEAIRKVQFLEMTLEEEHAEREAKREATERKAQRAAKRAYEQYIMENYGNQPQVYLRLIAIIYEKLY
jgi:hypothetical protein